MKIATIGDLRRLLAERQWSCEVLAQKVPVSNMTWRRLLEKDDSEPIPPKYQHLLAGLLEPSTPAMVDAVQVVTSGMQQTQGEIIDLLVSDGAALSQPEEILESSRKRARLPNVPQQLHELVKSSSRALFSLGRAGQFLVFGGLAYFVNPLDLIADPIVGLGFVDDIGIFLLIRKKLFPKAPPEN